MALGQAFFEIIANLNPLRFGLSAAGKLAFGAVSAIGKAVSALVSTIINKLVFSIKLASAAFVGFAAMSIRAFANQERTIRLFNALFGQMTEQMNQWADTLAEKTRIGSGTIKELASNLHLVVDEITDNQQQAADYTRRLTEMAMQMRSLFGGDLDEYMSVIRSAIFGAARAMRRYGIVLTDNEIKQRALNDEQLRSVLMMRAQKENAAEFVNGFGWIKKSVEDLTKYLTDNELAFIRMQLMLEKFRDLSARTAGGNRTLSDSFFILREQLTDTMENFGQGFKPTVQKVIDRISEFLFQNQQLFVKYGELVGQILEKLIALLERIYEAIQKGGVRQFVQQLIQDLSAAFQAVKPYAVELGKCIAQGFLEGMKTIRQSSGNTKLLEAYTEWGRRTSPVIYMPMFIH